MSRILQDIVNKERELYHPGRERAIAERRRAAKKTTCPRCGANTLTGDDHDRVAATTTIDLEPVTQLGEVVGILTGRRSYNLVRGAIHIRDFQAGRTSTDPVHLNHTCATR